MMRDLLPGLWSDFDLHPVLIHFPIAAWVLALTLGLWALTRRDEEARASAVRGAQWLLLVGTGFAVAALVTGYLAADELGHDAPGHDMVHTHRDLMLGATAAAVLASGAALLARRGRSARLLRGVSLGSLGLAVVLTTLGADRGAVVGHRMPVAHGGASHEHGGASHEHGAVGHEHGEAGHGHGEAGGDHGEAGHGHGGGALGDSL